MITSYSVPEDGRYSPLHSCTYLKEVIQYNSLNLFEIIQFENFLI